MPWPVIEAAAHVEIHPRAEFLPYCSGIECFAQLIDAFNTEFLVNPGNVLCIQPRVNRQLGPFGGKIFQRLFESSKFACSDDFVNDLADRLADSRQIR